MKLNPASVGIGILLGVFVIPKIFKKVR